LLRVAPPRRGRPGRAALAAVARVVREDGAEGRVDGPPGGRGPAAGGVGQAGRGAQVGAPPEGAGPIVGGPRPPPAGPRDPGGRLRFRGPQQSRSTAGRQGVLGRARQVQQLAARPRTEPASRQTAPPCTGGCRKARSRYVTTFVHLLSEARTAGARSARTV